MSMSINAFQKTFNNTFSNHIAHSKTCSLQLDEISQFAKKKEEGDVKKVKEAVNELIVKKALELFFHWEEGLAKGLLGNEVNPNLTPEQLNNLTDMHKRATVDANRTLAKFLIDNDLRSRVEEIFPKIVDVAGEILGDLKEGYAPLRIEMYKELNG